MSTGAIYTTSLNVRRQWTEYAPPLPSNAISVSRSVRADRSRIYLAITVPEYMEAWLSPPGATPGLTRVLLADPSFFIYGTTDDGSFFKIGCTFQQSRRSRLVFSWRRDSFPGVSSSTVRIRLRGDFDRTNVDVTHSGLNERERGWCSALWEASLEKLSRLF